jgi:hypothetical protein
VGVTRDLDPAAAASLLERPPRACLAFATAAGPQVVPVRRVVRDGRYLVAVGPGEGAPPAPGVEAVLLVDDGVHWFELRGVTLRGPVVPADPPGGAGGDRWFALEPVRAVAWDYGQLREVPDER